jgi:hypothetical protein
LGFDINRYQHETGGLFYPSRHDDIIYMEMLFSEMSPPFSNEEDYLLMAHKSVFLNRAASLGPLESNTRPIYIDWKDWFPSVFISSDFLPEVELLGSRWLFSRWLLLPISHEGTITIRDYHAGRVNRARRLSTSDLADPNMEISHSFTYVFDQRWFKNTSKLPELAHQPYFEVTRSLPEGIDTMDIYLLSDSAVIFIKVRTLVKLWASIARLIR